MVGAVACTQRDHVNAGSFRFCCALRKLEFVMYSESANMRRGENEVIGSSY